MKRTIIAVALALGALVLTGCGSSPLPLNNNAATQSSNTQSGSNYAEVPVKLSDGRTVLCLQYLGGYGATSCDWEHAK